MPVSFGGKTISLRIEDIEKLICFWSANEEIYYYTICSKYQDKYKITRQYKNPCTRIALKLKELNDKIYFVDKKNNIIEDITIRPKYSLINDHYRGHFFPIAEIVEEENQAKTSTETDLGNELKPNESNNNLD